MKFSAIFLTLAAGTLLSTACAQTETTVKQNYADPSRPAVVYFTSDISPEGLVKVYEALGVTPSGRVAVKISTGESEKSHQLDPQLIKDLVQNVGGTLVECNTAYHGSRYTTEDHLKAIAERGYNDIATLDIMDSEGDMTIPMQDTTWMKHNIVGKHLDNYDYLINLAHFKGHAMGGFGGVLKNQSIGVASRNGKAYIHTAGAYDTADDNAAFKNPHGQDAFIESMAGAAQAVHNYFSDRNGIIYIDVMNNMSVDCDCNGNPATPEMANIGILASTDPVALDKACLDLVFNHQNTPEDNNAALIERIESRHGTHIIDYAEKIGLGTTNYTLVDIDKK